VLKESAVKQEDKYPVYGASGIVGYLDGYTMSEDAILIIKDGSGVGSTFFASGMYSFIGTLNALTVKAGFNVRYLYYCLKSIRFEQFKTGMAIPHIYFKDYGKSKIWMPNIATQQSITDTLSTIERKLCIEQKLLQCMQEQRKYLLANLFI